MAISRKGRRRIEVSGRVFYWDIRQAGGRAGLVSDAIYMGTRAVVRIVSADKAWQITIDRGAVAVDPRGVRFRFPEPRVWTPGAIRAVLERADLECGKALAAPARPPAPRARPPVGRGARGRR